MAGLCKPDQGRDESLKQRRGSLPSKTLPARSAEDVTLIPSPADCEIVNTQLWLLGLSGLTLLEITLKTSSEQVLVESDTHHSTSEP